MDETVSQVPTAANDAGFDWASLTTGEGWMEVWGMAQPTVIKIGLALLILWIGLKIAKWVYRIC